MNLQDKLKAGVLNKLNAMTPLDEDDDRIDSDLTQGQPSLAQKIISDLFSKKQAESLAAARDEDAMRKRKEAEEIERQR